LLNYILFYTQKYQTPTKPFKKKEDKSKQTKKGLSQSITPSLDTGGVALTDRQGH